MNFQFVYVCMYACMWVSECMCTQLYVCVPVRVYPDVYVYVQPCACMCICVCSVVCLYVCVCSLWCVCVCVQPCACMCICVCSVVCPYACVCSLWYVCVCSTMRLHVYMCVFSDVLTHSIKMNLNQMSYTMGYIYTVICSAWYSSSFIEDHVAYAGWPIIHHFPLLSSLYAL